MKNALIALIALIALGCGGLESEPIVLDDATVDVGLTEDAGLTTDGGVELDSGIDAGTETDASVEPDASTTPDAGKPDAGKLDAGTPDVGVKDAGSPDAGTPDAGYDAGKPDAGTPDIGETWLDPATNRTWQVNHSEEKLDYIAAGRYCEKFGKWRIPTWIINSNTVQISTVDTCRKGIPAYVDGNHVELCNKPPCSCECYKGTGDKGSYFNPNLKVNVTPDDTCGNEDSDNMVFWTGVGDSYVLVYDASNGFYKKVYPDPKSGTPKFYTRCVKM